MSEGALSIVLERLAFEPGETLRGSYHLVMPVSRRLEEVEITVGWHTEGKGTKARGVDHREVHQTGEGWLDGHGAEKFSVVLPHSPLSYDGVLIKVCWTVRVHARFSGWRDLKCEQAFQLGHVPSVAMDSLS
jgi:hypothetical protein